MEQRLIDDLILKLHEHFPHVKAYDYKEDMQVEPPMFSIQVYDRQRRDRLTPGGFFYTYFFEILFFPGNDEPEEAYRDIELELTDAVWSFGDRYRSDDIHATVVDGVLHLFFSVTLELKRDKPPDPYIEQINTEVKVNEHKVSSQTIKRTT